MEFLEEAQPSVLNNDYDGTTAMTESTSQQRRPETHGSRTLTVNPTTDSANASATEEASDSREGTPSSVGVLRLRGGPVRRNHVAWSSETIDNEGMGKKKSKICCIYHKPRKFDESSSESDASSDDDGASCCHGPGGAHSGEQRTRPTGGSHVEEEASDSSDGGAGDGSARPSRPNKVRRKPKHQQKTQMNKYDVQPTGNAPSVQP